VKDVTPIAMLARTKNVLGRRRQLAVQDRRRSAQGGQDQAAELRVGGQRCVVAHHRAIHHSKYKLDAVHVPVQGRHARPDRSHGGQVDFMPPPTARWRISRRTTACASSPVSGRGARSAHSQRADVRGGGIAFARPSTPRSACTVLRSCRAQSSTQWSDAIEPGGEDADVATTLETAGIRRVVQARERDGRRTTRQGSARASARSSRKRMSR
jgi:hypothetical protein